MLGVGGHLVSNRPRAGAPLTVSAILERLARVSARPRYSYMVLTLIAERHFTLSRWISTSKATRRSRLCSVMVAISPR